MRMASVPSPVISSTSVMRSTPSPTGGRAYCRLAAQGVAQDVGQDVLEVGPEDPNRGPEPGDTQRGHPDRLELLLAATRR